MRKSSTHSRDARVLRARELRQDMTQSERKLWRALRQAPPPETHFRRQATIGPYFADFACHSARLVIEVDGETHASRAQSLHDAKRANYLEANGYRILRFWNNEILGNIAGVMSIIHATIAELGSAPPTPDPSPPFAPLMGGGERAAARGKDVHR